MCLQLVKALGVDLDVRRPVAFANRAALVLVLVEVAAAEEGPDVGGVEEDLLHESRQHAPLQHRQEDQQEVDEVRPNDRLVEVLVVQEAALPRVDQRVADAEELVQQVDRPAAPDEAQEDREVDHAEDFVGQLGGLRQARELLRLLEPPDDVGQDGLREGEQQDLALAQRGELDVLELAAGEVAREPRAAQREGEVDREADFRAEAEARAALLRSRSTARRCPPGR